MSNKPNAGFGGLFKNDYKEKDTHPDFRGTVALSDELIKAFQTNGKLDIAAWKREDKNGKGFLSLALSVPFKKESEAKSVADDDLDL